jgi:hypothetical protein
MSGNGSGTGTSWVGFDVICCRRCHVNSVLASSEEPRHGKKCLRRVAPNGARFAESTVPDSPMSSAASSAPLPPRVAPESGDDAPTEVFLLEEVGRLGVAPTEGSLLVALLQRHWRTASLESKAFHAMRFGHDWRWRNGIQQTYSDMYGPGFECLCCMQVRNRNARRLPPRARRLPPHARRLPPHARRLPPHA